MPGKMLQDFLKFFGVGHRDAADDVLVVNAQHLEQGVAHRHPAIRSLAPPVRARAFTLCLNEQLSSRPGQIALDVRPALILAASLQADQTFGLQSLRDGPGDFTLPHFGPFVSSP
jgi:hypothetical protein